MLESCSAKLVNVVGDCESEPQPRRVVIVFWKGSIWHEELFERFVLQHVRDTQDLSDFRRDRCKTSRRTYIIDLNILLPLGF